MKIGDPPEITPNMFILEEFSSQVSWFFSFFSGQYSSAAFPNSPPSSNEALLQVPDTSSLLPEFKDSFTHP